jgi:hypothetical protein
MIRQLFLLIETKRLIWTYQDFALLAVNIDATYISPLVKQWTHTSQLLYHPDDIVSIFTSPSTLLRAIPVRSSVEKEMSISSCLMVSALPNFCILATNPFSYFGRGPKLSLAKHCSAPHPKGCGRIAVPLTQMA